jgi:hypothetical protein
MPQHFAPGQRTLQYRPIFRARNRRFGLEQRRLPLPDAVQMATKTCRQLFRRGAAIVPAGIRNAFTDF